MNQSTLEIIANSNSNYLIFEISFEKNQELAEKWSLSGAQKRNERGYVVKVLDLNCDIALDKFREEIKEIFKSIEDERPVRRDIEESFDRFCDYKNNGDLNIIRRFIAENYGWGMFVNESSIEESFFNYHLVFNKDEAAVINTTPIKNKEDAKKALSFMLQEHEKILDTDDYPKNLIDKNRSYSHKLKNLIKLKLEEDNWEHWYEEELAESPELRNISRDYLTPKKLLIDDLPELKSIAEDSITRSKLNIFNKLNEKKIAGIGAAEDMNSSSKKDGFWKAGDFPLGSEFAIQWLKKELTDYSKNKKAKWVMLLGAAGNGKSHMAYQLKDQLQNDDGIKTNLIDIEADKGIHTFEIDFNDNEKPNKILRSVNDATVLEGDGLIKALNEYLEEKSNLLIAINKGVLVESQNFMQNKNGPDDDDPVKNLIKWLLNPKPEENDDFVIDECSNNTNKGYLWKLTYRNAVDIVVVHMDYGSLFEVIDDPVSYSDEGLELKPYSITQSKNSRSNSTAGKYVKEMLEQIKDLAISDDIEEAHALLDQDDYYSPYSANLSFLEKNLEGYLEIIRSSEIASGYNLTYRDLNHAFVLSLIGHDIRSKSKRATDRYTREERWFKSNKDKAIQQEENLQEIKYHQHLASKRMHMSIFHYESITKITNEYSGFQISEDDSFLNATSLIDPVFDSAKNNFEIVDEALSAMALNIPPSKIILEKEEDFKKAFTKFDENLEIIIMDFIKNSENKPFLDKTVSDLKRWYGVYLIRLFGLYKGACGHDETIEAWKALWESCSRGNNPRDDLNNGLNVILFGPDDDIYLPLLANRANPIYEQDSDEKEIAYLFKKNAFRFQWNIEGEKISASVLQTSESKSRMTIPINFELCKEMLICKNGNQGFSNSSVNLFNRFERFRNSLLSNDFIINAGDYLEPIAAFTYNNKRKKMN